MCACIFCKEPADISNNSSKNCLQKKKQVFKNLSTNSKLVEKTEYTKCYNSINNIIITMR